MSISENKINFKNYWYIACKSSELSSNHPIGRTILGEWIVLFRDESGSAIALQDRCPHRNFKLSLGRIKDNCLQCPYHGWVLDKDGIVCKIPSEGDKKIEPGPRRGIKYLTIEQDDFVYVKLEDNPLVQDLPFRMPKYKEKGYYTVRLFNKFKNNVTNCAENYVDVPHTVFVHDKIFRDSKNENIKAKVVREKGSVKIEYKNETDNLGWFSWYLNPKKDPIIHQDNFHGPNITSVEYIFSPGKEFYITSHCIPIDDENTHVYTDLTFKFGWINIFAAPIVKYQGQSVIDQDIEALDIQGEVIKKYGTDFKNSKADIVHVLIESIREEVQMGRDPKLLPLVEHDFEFWI